MPDIAQLGVSFNVQGADQAQRTFQSLETSAKRLEDTITRMQRAMQSTGGGGSTFGRMADDMRRAASASDQLANSMSAVGSAFKALAAAYVIKEIAGYLKEAALAGARFETLGVVMTQIGQNAGYTASQMQAYATGVQKSGIAMSESREIISRLAAAQINLADSQKLARIAQDAAVIGNINSTEALQRMVHGIVTAQPEILRGIGIQLNFESVYAKTAATLNRTAGDLNEHEKMLARTNAVIEYGTRLAGTYEAAMGTAGKQITSFTRYLQDFKTLMGEAFNPSTTAIMSEATSTMAKLQEIIARKDSQDALASLATVIKNVADSVIMNLPGALETLVSGLKDIIELWNSMPDWMKESLGAGTLTRSPAVAGATAGANALAWLDGWRTDNRTDTQRLKDERAMLSEQLSGGKTVWNDKLQIHEFQPNYVANRSKMEARLAEVDKQLAVERWKLEQRAIASGYAMQSQDMERVRSMTADNAQKAAEGQERIAQDQASEEALKTEKDFTALAKKSKAGKLEDLNQRYSRGKALTEQKIGWYQDQLQGEGLTREYRAELEGKLVQSRKLLTQATSEYNKELKALNKEETTAGEQAAKQLSAAQKLLHEMEGANKIAKMELGGDKFGAEEEKAKADYVKHLDDITEKLRQAKAGEAELAEAAKLAKEALDLKLQRIELEKYADAIRSTSTHMQKMAEMGGGDEWTAKRYAAWAEMEETVTLNKDNQLKVTQAIAEYEQKMLWLGQEQAKQKAQLRGELAGLLGNARQRYEEEVRVLEIEISQTTNAEKRALLEEKAARARAKASMNVGKLMDMGMAEYANKTYDELLNKIQNAIPDALDTLGQAVSGNLTDWINGTKSWDQAWKNIGETMRNAIVRTIIEVGVLIAKMELLRMLGYDTANATNGIGVNTSGGTQQGKAGQNGQSFDPVSTGKSILTNDTTIGMLDKAGLGMGIGTDMNSMMAASGGMPISQLESLQAAGYTSSSTIGGLGSMVGSAVGAGGIGYMAGSLVRPDVPSIGYIGAGTGVLAGALASSTSVGAALGTTGGVSLGAAAGGAMGIGAGLAATGIGALVALAAVGIMAATTPDTVKTSRTGGQGLTINMTIAGKPGIMGYDEFRQVRSGAFGSSSTTHFKGYKMADPELERAWNEGMLKVTQGLENSMEQLGMLGDTLKDFTFPIMFDVNAEHMDEILYNISNAMAEFAITASGLKEEFESVRKEGEMYIDELKRLGEAYSKTAIYAAMAGTSLANMSGSNSRVLQAGYASSLADRLGGYDQVQNMFNLSAKYTVSLSDQYKYRMNFLANEAGGAVGRLGKSGVNIDNFWENYQSAISGPLSVDDARKWYNAAQTVDAFYQSVVEYATQGNTKRIAALQKENQVLQQNAQLMKNQADLWGNVLRTVSSALDDLRLDKSLSNLSPTQIYQQSKAKYQDLASRAKGGDVDAALELAQFSKKFVQESKDYYAASEDYYKDFVDVTGSLDTVKSIAQMQYDVAVSQLNALNTQIEQNNLEIERLDLANQNITSSASTVAEAIRNLRLGGGGGGGGGGGSPTASAVNDAFVAAAVAQAMAPSYSPPAQSAPSFDFSSMFAPQADSGGSTQAFLDVLALGGGVPQYAEGGVFSPGWALVGEKGPEMVRFSSSGQVFTAQETKEIMSPSVDTSGMESGLKEVNRTTAAGYMSMGRALSENTTHLIALRRDLSRQAAAPKR